MLLRNLVQLLRRRRFLLLRQHKAIGVAVPARPHSKKACVQLRRLHQALDPTGDDFPVIAMVHRAQSEPNTCRP